MSDLLAKLNQDVAEIAWQDILPHAKRDAVIIVDEQLNLPEVGVAIAQDNTTLVQTWIEDKTIYKPSSEQLTNWNQDLQKQFTALIIQPFVLIQIVKSK